eukprot:6381435-Amphidinium_carterae.2
MKGTGSLDEGNLRSTSETQKQEKQTHKNRDAHTSTNAQTQTHAQNQGAGEPTATDKGRGAKDAQ